MTLRHVACVFFAAATCVSCDQDALTPSEVPALCSMSNIPCHGDCPDVVCSASVCADQRCVFVPVDEGEDCLNGTGKCRSGVCQVDQSK